MKESQGASGSSGAGRRTDEHSHRPTMGQENGRNKVANLNLIWTESSALISAVLGWNSTTQYWTRYGVTEAGTEEEEETPSPYNLTNNSFMNFCQSVITSSKEKKMKQVY